MSDKENSDQEEWIGVRRARELKQGSTASIIFGVQTNCKAEKTLICMLRCLAGMQHPSVLAQSFTENNVTFLPKIITYSGDLIEKNKELTNPTMLLLGQTQLFTRTY